MIKTFIFSIALYLSFTLIIKIIINLIKAHGVNIMRAAGYDKAVGEYKDYTAFTVITIIMWSMLYYLNN
jgi:hypothetical protein